MGLENAELWRPITPSIFVLKVQEGPILTQQRGSIRLDNQIWHRKFRPKYNFFVRSTKLPKKWGGVVNFKQPQNFVRTGIDNRTLQKFAYITSLRLL